MVLQMKSTDSQQILSLQTVGISLGALRKQYQASFKLIIFHELLPLDYCFVGDSFCSVFLAAFF